MCLQVAFAPGQQPALKFINAGRRQGAWYQFASCTRQDSPCPRLPAVYGYIDAATAASDDRAMGTGQWLAGKHNPLTGLISPVCFCSGAVICLHHRQGNLMEQTALSDRILSGHEKPPSEAS